MSSQDAPLSGTWSRTTCISTRNLKSESFVSLDQGQRYHFPTYMKRQTVRLSTCLVSFVCLIFVSPHIMVSQSYHFRNNPSLLSWGRTPCLAFLQDPYLSGFLVSHSHPLSEQLSMALQKSEVAPSMGT